MRKPKKSVPLKSWFITAYGHVTEHYTVVASTEDEAREKFGRGECSLTSSESYDCKIHSIEEDK